MAHISILSLSLRDGFQYYHCAIAKLKEKGLNTRQVINLMKVLSDDSGSIELLGCFGDDLTVVNAARVSFSKESKELTDGDKKLITYLAKHNHVSPFFHPQIRLRLKMPIFVAREWYRHTIGFARNEVSRRYVDTEPDCYVPEISSIRERDPNLKQGSKPNPTDNAEYARECIEELTHSAIDTYNALLAAKVAPEVARMVLPQSMHTEFIETASLYAYARLCKLRLSPDAQHEIRLYAEALSNLLSTQFPISWKALNEA
jgi:thymidylate synthase (FAD)